jgi:hypothetical protein
MFYTIVSRIPFILNDKSNSKLLKIFILGSVLYILLHYWLNRNSRGSLIDKYKGYLYYIMMVDFTVSYFLLKLSKPIVETNEEEEEEENSIKQKQLLLNQMQQYKQMEEMQKLQQLQAQQSQDKETPFVKRGTNEEETESSSEEEVVKPKKNSKNNKNVKNVKSMKNNNSSSDVDIPVFEKQ